MRWRRLSGFVLFAALLAFPAPAGAADPVSRTGTGGAPACSLGDVTTELAAYEDWATTILDRSRRLPRSYAPRDLVPVSRAGLGGSADVRVLVIADLAAMVRAARTAGIPLAAVSGYRGYDAQAWTFAHWVGAKGYELALGGAARAGHSEHQLGTAIDFTSYPGVEPWYYVWFGSPTATWLAANAWRYGFVMSYPAEREKATCYHHEPWHFRYVGRATATAVHESGGTLREYLWELAVARRSREELGFVPARIAR